MSQIATSPGTGIQASSLVERIHTFLNARDNGQSVVEFAVCLPLLLLILTGISTFGIALNNYLMLTDAVSIGARQLAISRGQTDPCSIVAANVKNAAPYLKPSNLTFNVVLNGSSYSGTSCGTSTSAPGKMIEGASAQVVVTYPCNIAVYGVNLAPSCTLTAQTTELVQ